LTGHIPDTPFNVQEKSNPQHLAALKQEAIIRAARQDDSRTYACGSLARLAGASL